MEGFRRPWWVAGGWAIDLFLGRVTREHGDLDVAVLRRDQADLFHHLRGWDLRVAHGGRLDPWRGTRLELPFHVIWGRRADEPPPASVEEFARAPSFVEFVLQESSGRNWVFRRDPAITMRLDGIGLLTPDGIPFLHPEIVLLFKAKRAEEDPNPADFQAVRPRLPDESRSWLKAALERSSPGHPWLRSLGGRGVSGTDV